MTVIAKRYDPPFKSPTQEPFICWTITKDDGTHDVTHGGTFPAELLENLIDALIELRARTLFGLPPPSSIESPPWYPREPGAEPAPGTRK